MTLTVAACGGLGADESTRDGTIVIGISRKLTGLDPAKGQSVDGDGSVQRALYSSLTTYDPQLNLKGDLATNWTQDDPTTWTFHIRPGVTFSDGTPLRGEDIKYSFDRFLDPASTYTTSSATRAIISSVDTPDDTTLIVHTNGPYIDLADRLASFFIVQKAFVQAHPEGTSVLGTGPYKLDTVDLENGATLSPNPNFYGAAPQWKKVEYRVLENEAARVQAAQSGSVDVAIQYEPASLKLFADSDYDTGTQWSSWNNTLRINENIKPLGDVRVRQAINYAIDKKSIIDNILDTDVAPLAGQAIAEPYDSINKSLSAYPYDPQRARQLLAEAGYPNGFDTELSLTTGSYVAQDPVSQVLAKQLGAVGIKVNITNASFPTWVQRTYSDNAAPLYYIGYTSGYKAIAERLRTYASSNAQSHYATPDTVYDDLVTKVTGARTREEQQRYVDLATQRYRDQAHAIFLWPQPLTWVVRKDLAWTPRPEHWLVPQEFTVKS
ncbi:ABC transporter substrate-binding protein [Gordonia sp. ABSL1-1]|uniref:ABC transporter substrate-binding protein n=1 Tax=Gordonia sp. ABSL1-1 TaxID=3053923 RepID=UPI0025743ECD|nr:ABC transporter substrate-binding protein [Gordonia sp. ABSL1-1]MDL9937289.1 ABC transporter substrate-binding protein [Gordonia sp. ABSL1-1]